MKLMTIIIGLLILPAMAYYQKSVEIRGVVLNAVEKTPLMDSHVYVRGTNFGTVTDFEGKFSLKIPLIYRQKPLIVSYVGFATYEQIVAEIEQKDLQIALQPGAIVLEEIIVTPGKELLVDRAIDKVMINYEDTLEMLTDFYLSLFVFDTDHKVLKTVYQDIDKN